MKKSMRATSEKVRNYIPDDLALCILSKLPLKPLKRFGCVRKSWTLLFENHHFMSIFCKNFISYHHSYYDDTSLLLQCSSKYCLSLSGDELDNIVKLNWQNPFQEENPYFLVLDSGSITGILCLYKIYGSRTVLWNPTIEEFKIVPPSPLHYVSPYLEIYVTPVGFGYDQVREDYKYIRCVTYDPLSLHDCEVIGISHSDRPQEDSFRYDLWEIYSLRSNTWRKLDVNNSFLKPRHGVGGNRVYMNGMCHWWFDSVNHEQGVDLQSFDLGNEVLFTTLIPLDTNSRMIYIMELFGFIAFISWIFDTTTFDISILGEVGVKESWIKLYTIRSFSSIEQPIGAGKNGDIFFQKEDGKIVRFNLGTHVIEELCIKGENSIHMLIYKKCLLPL